MTDVRTSYRAPHEASAPQGASPSQEASAPLGARVPQEAAALAPRPFFVAGVATRAPGTAEVRNPFDGSVVGTHALPTPAHVEQAVAAAHSVRAELAAISAGQRAAALQHVSQRLAERADEVARLITAENGKPLMWARGEVARGVSTFRWAAEEARRFGGELQRLDTDESSTGRAGIIRRFPIGPVLGISPFNFPLNLVAHKLAPAIAVGAPIVLKPAPATPLTALLLGELLAETDLPEGAWSILPVGNDLAPALVRDDRLPVISFTGSDTVGYQIQDSVPRKHVTLELGGNAAAVVCADYCSDADLDRAAARIATYAMYQAGQSCISVQRALIDTSVYDDLAARIVVAVAALVTGSPWDEKTVVGPLVDEAAANRVESWVDEAVAAGATVLTGGRREGATYAPTVLADVPRDAKVCVQEVFGPVLVLQRVDGVDDAFAAVNDSAFGLQAGVFTHDIATAFRAHRELEVGGVVIGDVPSFRADQMPYGGVKASGVGREGLRSAMADYTYEKVMVLTGIDL